VFFKDYRAARERERRLERGQLKHFRVLSYFRVFAIHGCIADGRGRS
jgi:hypothetical protein